MNARLYGAAVANTERMGSHTHPGRAQVSEQLLRRFDAAGLPRDTVERWFREGAGMDEAQAGALCAAALAAG